MSTDQTDICSAGNGLEDRQRITKANEKIDSEQRLDPCRKRVSDRELFNVYVVLFEKTGIHAHISHRGSDFPARIGQPEFL